MVGGFMERISLKKIILCCILVIITVFSIITPVFDVYALKFSKISLLGECGFDFFDGRSFFYENYGVEIFNTKAISSISILCLTLGILSFILAAVNFVVSDEKRNTILIILLSVSFICSIAYMIMGIVTYVDLLNLVKTSVDESGSLEGMEFGSGTISTITLSYIPLILHSLLCAFYFVCNYFIKEGDAYIEKKIAIDSDGDAENENNNSPTTVRENKSACEQKSSFTQTKTTATRISSDYEYSKLRELKSLLDDGILTQEEFVSEKIKILNLNK